MAVGNEKAPKEIICPGCGGVIKNTAFNPITDTCGAMLQDGWLCPECAYRLRPKYPMYYTDDEPATLEKAPDAGRPILTMLRNDFLYADPLDPVNSTAFSYTGALRSDPLAKLRSGQIKDELASIDAYKQEVSRDSAVPRTCSRCSRLLRCPSSNRFVRGFLTSSVLRAPSRLQAMYVWALSRQAIS